jgi:hypothetical protein
VGFTPATRLPQENGATTNRRNEMAKGRIILVFEDPDKNEEELYAELAEHVSNAYVDFGCVDHDIQMDEE